MEGKVRTVYYMKSTAHPLQKYSSALEQETNRDNPQAMSLIEIKIKGKFFRN